MKVGDANVSMSRNLMDGCFKKVTEDQRLEIGIPFERGFSSNETLLGQFHPWY